MDRGAWQATVCRVSKSDMTKWLSMHTKELWHCFGVQDTGRSFLYFISLTQVYRYLTRLNLLWFIWKKEERKWSRSVVPLCNPMDSSLHEAPLSKGFSRQEYWSVLPFPPPPDLPDPGIKPRSSALQADSLLSRQPGKPHLWVQLT